MTSSCTIRNSRMCAMVSLLALLFFGLPTVASAHALGAEAKLKDGKVYVEAFFDDDSPAVDAKVHVEDEAKKTVVEGRTDKKGHWSFPSPPAGKYRVIVDAGAGHRASVGMNIPGVPPAKAEPAAETKTPSIDDNKESSEVVVSEGARRAEFTGIPWLKIGIGFGVLGLLGLIAPIAIRKARRAKEGVA